MKTSKNITYFTYFTVCIHCFSYQDTGATVFFHNNHIFAVIHIKSLNLDTKYVIILSVITNTYTFNNQYLK